LRRACDEAASNEVRLVDLLDRPLFLAGGDRNRLEADRAALLEQHLENAPVERAKPEAIDAEQGEAFGRHIAVDAVVVALLGEVADAAKEAVRDARRASAAFGDEIGRLGFEVDLQRFRRPLEDFRQNRSPVEYRSNFSCRPKRARNGALNNPSRVVAPTKVKRGSASRIERAAVP
jgi:hypothetical protein